MIKKKKTKTTYQQKPRRISKWRSFKRFVISFLKTGYYGTAIICGLVLIGSGWWWVQSGTLSSMSENAKNATLAKTADAGLSLQYIYLEGSSSFKKKSGETKDKYMEQVTASLGLKPGDPILGLSVEAIQNRIRTLSWVKDVVVERQLPDTLHIHLEERRPVAVWQYQGKLRLVDETGHVIEEENASAEKYRRLLLVVGEDAPQHTTELMRMLSREPELFPQIASAVRVGNRRWDIRFTNKLEVKLPSENPERAWLLLAQMQKQQQILEKDVRVVDLRLEDRVYIDMPPQSKAKGGGPAGAREA
jgi:cell division protein FtsQ